MTSGVYIITNTSNGKHYIGYSADTKNRLSDHRKALRGGYHNNVHLQKAFDKYGENAFLFEHLEHWPLEVLPSMENYWCKMLQTHDRNFGYNIRPTDGINGCFKNSKESILKMSETAKKRTVSPRLGTKHTEESKIRMAVAAKARVVTEETKRKMSESKRGVLNCHSKKVIDTDNNKIYDCVGDAAAELGYNYWTLACWLNGKRTNKTTLRYAS